MSGDVRQSQNFINSWAAETFEIDIDRPEWAEVKQRLCEEEPRGRVPTWALALTAGVDVQKRCSYYVVRAWGLRGRSQLVDCGSVPFNEGIPQGLRETMKKIMGSTFRDMDNNGRRVEMACVDSGYATADVYDAVRKYGIGRARAIKGAGKSTGARAPWVMNVVQTDPRTGDKLK